MSILLFTKELNEILDQMDIPDSRKHDISWLVRNLGIRNSNHPACNKAMLIIKSILKSQRKDNA